MNMRIVLRFENGPTDSFTLMPGEEDPALWPDLIRARLERFHPKRTLKGAFLQIYDPQNPKGFRYEEISLSSHHGSEAATPF